ncbi:MAG TPA: sigma-54 dependent transcriptional regulator [Rhodanobacteraceae bacterium]
MRTVLIIDDQAAVRDALSLLLSLNDIRPIAAAAPEDGLALLRRKRVDVVIADMNFSADTTSGEEGVALFHAVRDLHPDLPVILLTGWSHLETAVKLVKAGAADYLSKPWDDAKLLASVENLIELAENARVVEAARLTRKARRAALENGYDLRGVVFASEEMLGAIELACQVARSDVPVLITGPNGAGKDRVADIVHANSAAAGRPMVTVNCGALPGDLIEAELFGADAGAFTGANRPREGRFEVADGGTLFLDEIGNLSATGQMKLLRVLESGEFERLGSARTRKVKVRIISATNADIPAMIEADKFREDLFYRLNTIEIDVPPLCDRPNDILPLAEHFLGARAALSDDARDALLAYPWPGNVRELKNVVDRALLLCGGKDVTVPQLGLPPEPPNPVPRSLDDPSREVVEQALVRAKGVISRAARSLGLSRQALYRRMQRYGMTEG